MGGKIVESTKRLNQTFCLILSSEVFLSAATEKTKNFLIEIIWITVIDLFFLIAIFTKPDYLFALAL